MVNGDYFKAESIAWSYEFLTSKDWLGIDPKKLAVTVLNEMMMLQEMKNQQILRKQGITNISYLPKEDNWWGPAGLTGPCGPDTEIFYWVWKEEFPPVWSTVWNDSKNWMEIWIMYLCNMLKHLKEIWKSSSTKCWYMNGAWNNYKNLEFELHLFMKLMFSLISSKKSKNTLSYL